MPTGYTARLYDGEQSFEEFVLHAAHGFVPNMYDHDMTTPFPEEYEVSPRYQTNLDDAVARLKKVSSWTPEEAQAQAENSYSEQMIYWMKSRNEERERSDRILAMMKKVEEWQITDPSLENLKDFLLDQLRITLRSDVIYLEEPKLRTGAEYKERAIKSALRDIEWATEDLDRACRVTKETNSFLRAVRESLKNVD